MLGELGKAAAEFSATASVPGPNNSTRVVEVFNLPKRETLIRVSGYSITTRLKFQASYTDPTCRQAGRARAAQRRRRA